MEYNFSGIEKNAKEFWKERDVYKVDNNTDKPKYYVLDMFPYPSGAGLHVGHPLGYIASDIFARYKRMKGYNVLHPMGFDAFGLPAEQYAIETGQHPAETTKQNIARYKEQLDNIGFCYDWSREVITSNPKYYKWTQWIFLQLFKSWYNRQSGKAEPLPVLENIFFSEGNRNHPCPGDESLHFTAEEWTAYDEKQQQDILMNYRLAFSGFGEVNWCEALGTVLANDEVVNGVSERGGYPVVKKKLRQWYLRITEYADRLLEGLEQVDFSEAMKDMQRNWIGKSIGAEIRFLTPTLSPGEGRREVSVFTTRPDTIFGVDFMVLAPEHDLVLSITTAEQKDKVEEYISYVKSRSERERMAEKKISGCFTGAYAIHPFSGRQIPIWISEYVLAGYGTGAIMAVPCGDERDHKFAKHFNIPITNIIGDKYTGEDAYTDKDFALVNSDFINGMSTQEAAAAVIRRLEDEEIGQRKVNFKIRDAAFSRQRYWGEPFPIIWKDGIAYPLDELELPLVLPHIEHYGPGPEGEGPLANLKEWSLVPGFSPGGKEEEKPAFVPKYAVKSPHQYELARQNRKGHTEAEAAMWHLVRNSKLGVKFRRQHPIDAYIVDFISLQDKLAVEIDGGYHENEEQRIYDENRTKVLNEIGFDVIRFTNEEVLQNPYIVRDKIKAILSRKKEQTDDQTLALSPGEGHGLRETNTMPGYAGSSWYFLRYMDPHNDDTFCDRKLSDYWNQVDLYIGGTEHAVGHLLYSRMWIKVMYDLGLIGFDEPFKKLVNQGMIQGSSRFVFRFDYTLQEEYESIKERLPYIFVTVNKVSKYDKGEIFMKEFPGILALVPGLENIVPDGFNNYFASYKFTPVHVDVNIVDGLQLNIEKFRDWRSEYKDAIFICEDGIISLPTGQSLNTHVPLSSGEGRGEVYICGAEVEKMSKRYYNVVNPDDIVAQYGADTFRMYEMFLGPIDMSKPWDTKGIEGVHRFLKKMWRLYADEQKGYIVTDEKATDAELKALHKTIKKIEEDTERFSFNTCVSQFMICVNELSALNCHKKEVLEPLAALICPFAPHLAEELWRNCFHHEDSVIHAAFPKSEATYLVENSKVYPVAVNGKTRAEMEFALDAEQSAIEQAVLAEPAIAKWLEGKAPKKIIYVKGKMINVVV